jgi:two-component system response regulator AtoC
MMEIFMRYHWPGNVRELENLLTRGVVVSKGQVLSRNDFPQLTDEAPDSGGETKEEDVLGEPGNLLTLDAIEERYIRKVLRENSSKNKGEICEILGISRPTFERKLDKYGITFEKE